MSRASLPIAALLLASVAAACGRAEAPQPVPEPAQSEAAVPAAAVDHSAEPSAPASAHVHGLADLAISREGNRYLGELIAPMANFGLAESEAALPDAVIAELSGLVELEGGTCDASPPHPMSNASGEHTDAVVHFIWTCAAPDGVTAIRFAGFEAFSGFETVRTIYITDTGQDAADLTASARELSLK